MTGVSEGLNRGLKSFSRAGSDLSVVTRHSQGLTFAVTVQREYIKTGRGSQGPPETYSSRQEKSGVTVNLLGLTGSSQRLPETYIADKRTEGFSEGLSEFWKGLTDDFRCLIEKADKALTKVKRGWTWS